MELNTTLKNEGFGLEVKACNILKEKHFICERNPLVAQGDVDIIAHSYDCNLVLIIQVKGSASDKILSLYCNTTEMIRRKPLGIIGSFDTYFNAPLLQYQKKDTETGSYIYLEPNPIYEKIVMVSKINARAAMRHAYSGDFRSASVPYKKTPRQDDKNNLYKGLQQAVEGTSSLQEIIDKIVSNSPQRAMKVFPIIVTNTKIFLKEDDEANEIETKWALYQHKNISSKVEYIFIVNVDFLGEFLEIFIC